MIGTTRISSKTDEECEEEGYFEADPAPGSGGGAVPGGGYEGGAGGYEVHEDELHAGAKVEQDEAE